MTVAPSIQIRNYTHDVIPHTFIVVTDSKGVEHGYGFYPETKGSPNDNGLLKNDTDHPSTSESYKYELTADQYSNLMDFIHQTETNPPPYSFLFGSQCATWALTAMQKAYGAQFSNLPNMGPSDFWHDLSESLLWNPWTIEIKIQTTKYWQNGVTFVARAPLAIDLAGDGIKTVAINTAAPIIFDHNGDGAKSATGWLDGSDAWLVRDINANGAIDSGLELFGVDTDITVNSVTRKATNGFEALAALNTNGDTVFNAADGDVFTQVRLWQDLNQNGASDAGELSTLADKGITSIALNFTSTNTNLGNGNTVTGKAVVTRTTGTSEIDSVSVAADSAAYNLNLADNPFYSSFTTPIALTSAAIALPEMHGSGAVRDLREAMSLGSNQASTLATTVTQFAAGTTRDAQTAVLDQLVQQWGATSALTTSSPFVPGAADEFTLINPSDLLGQKIQTFARANPALYHKIIALEQFNGATGLTQLITRWGSTLPSQVVSSMESAYSALRESVYGALAMQTRLKPYIDSINLVVDVNGIHFDNAALSAKLDAYQRLDAKNALIDLVDLNRYAQSTLIAVGWNAPGTLSNWVDTLAVNSPLRATLATLGVLTASNTKGGTDDDIYLGDANANTFSAGDGADVLAGSGGNDALYGQSGNDALDGGAGNDYLDGGDGADTYLFGKGAGQDTIGNYDSDAVNVNADSILLNGNVTTDEVTLTRSFNDLVISISGTDDQLRVRSYFNSDGAAPNVVENIKFADSTVWDVAAVKAKVLHSSASDDTLYGYATNDSLSAGEGNDIVYGNAGDDQLNGDGNNDCLYGGDGADTLYGGSGGDKVYGDVGDDTLYGSSGDDTLFGGDGGDSLLGDDDNDFLVGENLDDSLYGGYGNDTLWGDASQATFAASTNGADNLDGGEGEDYIVGGGLTDTLIGGSDDDTLIGDDISNYLPLTNHGADLLEGGDGRDSLLGAGGNDTLYGGNGNDFLAGEDQSSSSSADQTSAMTGDDTLYGDQGKDTLVGGMGADYLIGGSESDELYGGQGDDTLEGGVGNDALRGGAGVDTYRFGIGSGQDTIYTDDRLGQDTIELGTGIKQTDITLNRTARDLIISVNGTSDRLYLSSYFDYATNNSGQVIKNIVFDDKTVWDVATVKANVALLKSGNDTAYGSDQNDPLIGTDYNNALYGYGGNDRLDGGKGDDTLYGGAGADTYVFDIGDGRDTIDNHDTDALNVNADSISLGSGILSTNVKLTRTNDDLILGFNSRDDGLLVSNYFAADATGSYAVEQIKFADDPTVWDIATVKAKFQTSTPNNDILYGFGQGDSIDGGQGADQLFGSGGNDTLYGGAGRDTVHGDAGDDSLRGDAGNDTLYGDAANDVLDGGAGNDLLYGGTGADTYMFGLGSGQDTIDNHDTTDTASINVIENDRILLGAGITVENITLATNLGGGLFIGVKGVEDSLFVTYYFGNDGASAYAVKNIVFADDTVWDVATVKAKMLAPTPGVLGVTLDGGSTDDSLQGGAGNDKIYGYAGKDSLDGGPGDDTLDGGTGNDTFLFNKGGGSDYITAASTTAANVDTLVLGAGIGVSDVIVRKTENTSLLLKVRGSRDTIFVLDYFKNETASSLPIDKIKFADTTIWNTSAIKAMGILATQDDDEIYGYYTNDTITGLDGEDTLHGLSGNDQLNGGDGADSLFGDNGDDIIHGGAQNDFIEGGFGANALYGDAGNDYLFADTWGSDTLEDTLDGGAGDDYLDGGYGNVAFNFAKGGGHDTVSAEDLIGNTNHHILSFGEGINPLDVVLQRDGSNLLLSINGTADSVTILDYFRDGDGRVHLVEQIKFFDKTSWNINTVRTLLAPPVHGGDLVGSGPSDTIHGGMQNDRIFGGWGADSLFGEEGDDELSGGGYSASDTDTLDGGAGSDSLHGNDSDDVLIGGAGNDYLWGDAGSDTFVFGRGDGMDVIMQSGSATEVNITTDVLSMHVKAYEVSVSRFNNDLRLDILNSSDRIEIANYFATNAASYDRVARIEFTDQVWDANQINASVLAATADYDVLIGYDTNDTILGLDGNDTIRGMAGNDSIEGDDGKDALTGGEGEDAIHGGEQDDYITGGVGMDSLYGDGGGDSLFGEDGTDLLDGGLGADTLSGGANDDHYIVDNQGDVIIEVAGNDAAISYDTVEASVSYTLSDNVEALLLTGSDNINGTANSLGSELTGNTGNNHLKGGNGLDILFGDDGIDTLEGGAGDDYYYLTSNEDTVIEQAGGGLDQIWAYGDGIRMADNVDRLYMQSYLARTAYGNNGNNLMGGNNRANTLYGNGGNDRLFGYNGDDTLYGGQGNDSLYGSIGNDVYHVQRGDGQDLISDYDATVGAKDRLVFDGAIDSSQVWLTRSGNDLVLSIIGTSDKVTIGSWYVSNDNKVESITAAGNGKTLDYTKVDALVNAMAGFTPPAAGQTTLPQAYQGQLAGVIAANWV